YLALGNQTIEKHYLYWIATSENINMEKEQLNPIENIPYGDYLKEFQKYHYQIAYFEVDGLGKCNLTKKKIVK
ncbi:MAG: hypothetical protein IH571_03480, partial [Acholeplasmataceae bacterium]|nr:hypothetical protein [Acholeplasmataceae bacterium]